MQGVEFQTRPNGDVEIIESDRAPYILTELHRDIVVKLYDTIRADYPDAFNALSKRYQSSLRNKHYFEFLLVRGFIKCNWSQFDDRKDIDEKGKFSFEYCACPMRGECPDWNVICRPKKSNVLSPAEMNVFRLVIDGKTTEEISVILFCSPHTVHNHRNSILSKLDLKNVASMVAYWHDNKLQ